MTMYADRALPIDRSGGEWLHTGTAGRPGHGSDVGPRTLLAGTLHVLDGTDQGQVWPLTPGAYLIGRAADCTLPLTDSEVSRWHCMLGVTSQAPGQACTVTVEDLGSSNGTIVDGAGVKYPAVLGPGATIVIGRTTLGWAPAGWHPSASPPPVHAPPVHVPPVHASPVHASPVHVPPVHASPVHVPPVHASPVHAAAMVAAAPAPVRSRASAHPPASAPWPDGVSVPAVSPVPAAVPVSVAHAHADAPPARTFGWLRSSAPARPTPTSTALSTLTSLTALGTLAAIGALAHLPLLIPPLAARKALIAAGTALPLAQPRNVIGGQVVSALVGFAVVALIGAGAWAAALAGGAALGAMLLLRVSHSPAAATAVIVGATGPSAPRFLELLVLAAVILVGFGIIGARVDGKTYPVYWW